MTRISVRIIPNASTNEIGGLEGRVWKIRLTAPPIEGKANEALIRFLAEVLDIAPSNISIVKGHGSKHKTIEIAADSDELLRAFTQSAHYAGGASRP